MRPKLSRGGSLVFATAAVLWISAPGCASKKPTELMVAVSSEGTVPKEIDGLEVEVQRGDSTPFFQIYSLDPASATAGLPGTIALSNGDGSDSSPVTVVIRGTMAGKRRVLRQATLGFSENKTKLLKMPLRYSCFDFPTMCDPGTSCKGGECAPDAIDVATLPDFSPDQVFGVQGSSACFDDRLTECLTAKTEVPLAPLMAATTTDCTVALGAVTGTGLGGASGASSQGGAAPVGAAGSAGLLDAPATSGLNVAVHWKRAGDPEKLTVLDFDKQEGWQYTPNKDGFTLARGLCEAVKAGAITRIIYSPHCAPKTLTQPICTMGTGSGDGSGGSAGAGAGGTHQGDDPCPALAQAYCAKSGACDAGHAPAASGPTSCVALFGGLCEGLLNKLPGVDPAAVTACSATIGMSSCDTVVSTAWQCAATGTLPDGAGCLDSAQCKSGRCAGKSLGSCGTCAAKGNVGDPCLDFIAGTSCKSGLSCIGNQCAPALVGSACPGPDNTACPNGGADLMTCVAGKCQLGHAKAGDTCNGNGSKICASVDAALVCSSVQGPGTCVPAVPNAEKGQPCGGTGAKAASCAGQDFVLYCADPSGAQATSNGVCAALPTAGQSCQVSKACAGVSQCIQGTCIDVLPTCAGSGAGGSGTGGAGGGGGGKSAGGGAAGGG